MKIPTKCDRILKQILRKNKKEFKKELEALKDNMIYPESYDGEREEMQEKKNKLENKIKAIDAFLS